MALLRSSRKPAGLQITASSWSGFQVSPAVRVQGQLPVVDSPVLPCFRPDPMDQAVETGGAMSEETRATIDRLHTILRPYMLRRLKSEVETQLPAKHEHVIYCKLSKRQRFLYDEFMSRASTRESLVSGGYLGVANCLMQLRKVCNHPDLFEVRPVRT